MIDGKPVGEHGIVGFDRASIMLGAAADAPNYWLIGDLSNGTLGVFSKRDEPVLESSLHRRSADFPLQVLRGLQKLFKKYFDYFLTEAICITLPNRFASRFSADSNSSPTNLTLLDESEMGQALPLWTQIQTARKPEFIIAWDDDEDTVPYGELVHCFLQFRQITSNGNV